MDEALVEIQTRLAHQENMLETLNQVVIRQQKQIDTLEVLAQGLLDKLQTLSEMTAEPVDNEPPPHY